jgi:proteasome assembly chaperone (PAC2) family protein
MKTLLQELGKLSKIGGQVLFGTDVGYMTDYNPATSMIFP